MFGCKLDSFIFRQLQLCQILMVMTHHTWACVGFPSFLSVYDIYIFLILLAEFKVLKFIYVRLIRLLFSIWEQNRGILQYYF